MAPARLGSASPQMGDGARAPVGLYGGAVEESRRVEGGGVGGVGLGTRLSRLPTDVGEADGLRLVLRCSSGESAKGACQARLGPLGGATFRIASMILAIGVPALRCSAWS